MQAASHYSYTMILHKSWNSLLELFVLEENDVAWKHHQLPAGVLVLEGGKVLQQTRETTDIAGTHVCTHQHQQLVQGSVTMIYLQNRRRGRVRRVVQQVSFVTEHNHRDGWTTGAADSRNTTAALGKKKQRLEQREVELQRYISKKRV